MTKMWKYKHGVPAPIAVMAEIPEWPNYDADGDQIFINTHFLEEEKAWDVLEKNDRAGLSLAVGRLEDARTQLSTSEKKVVEAAEQLNAMLKAKEKRFGKGE